MKHKFLAACLVLNATFLVSGCSTFYSAPTPTPSETAEPTETATATATPTPTPTEEPALNKVEIGIIDSSAYIDNGYVEVVAEALQVLEDDGKCTLTLTQGSIVRVVSVSAGQNVNSTVCASMQVPLSKFKGADISFSVEYVSSNSAGRSTTGIIKIQ